MTSQTDPVDDVIKPMTSDPERAYYCGGWGGFSRHPNYLGEIMTSFGWSLLAGESFYLFKKLCLFKKLVSSISGIVLL